MIRDAVIGSAWLISAGCFVMALFLVVAGRHQDAVHAITIGTLEPFCAAAFLWCLREVGLFDKKG